MNRFKAILSLFLISREKWFRGFASHSQAYAESPIHDRDPYMVHLTRTLQDFTQRLSR
jgi:hypothetical protein